MNELPGFLLDTGTAASQSLSTLSTVARRGPRFTDCERERDPLAFEDDFLDLRGDTSTESSVTSVATLSLSSATCLAGFGLRLVTGSDGNITTGGNAAC